MTRTRNSEHITPVLRTLHWLPVRQRITYKILLLTYKTLNGMAPKYIADLLQPYTPTRQLRSCSKNLLVTPKFDLKFYGDRSFQVAAPRLWNFLTDDIRSILACENIRFSSLFAAGDVSRGGTSTTQWQKFHTDDAINILRLVKFPRLNVPGGRSPKEKCMFTLCRHT